MKSLKGSLLALTLALGTVTLPAVAAVPTDDSLRQLMSITQVDEMAKQMAKPDDNMMAQMLDSSLIGVSEQDISPYQRQQLAAIITKYNNEMLDDKYFESIIALSIQGYINAAKKHFTQEEVDAQIAFYGSPLGQSIINKQPAMMQDYMSETMPIVMESTMERMQEVMPRMQAEIEALNFDN